jgi:hypothetical protein
MQPKKTRLVKNRFRIAVMRGEVVPVLNPGLLNAAEQSFDRHYSVLKSWSQGVDVFKMTLCKFAFCQIFD